MWMWVIVFALLYVVSVIGPLWTFLAAVFAWFILIPVLSLWIAIHIFIEEASNEEN